MGTKTEILFVLLDPANKPFPDLRYVLPQKLELEAQVDEFDEVAEVVVVPFVLETAVEHDRSNKQSPLGPGFGRKG